ncbi:MAG: CotH kinase family protein [Muribaculaceae bacterium]|nr:CotH kinase family protein [Muribaculaceae bacterium]
MRRLFALVLLVLAVMTVRAQFTINNLSVVLDSLTGNFLCSIPQENYDGDWTAKIKLVGGEWDKIIIDGLEITIKADYTFSELTGGKIYSFKAVTGTDTLSYGINFTYYPILLLEGLEGEFDVNYKSSLVTMIMPGELPMYSLPSKAKWRGNTTVRYEREKRNYHIKFFDDDGNAMNYRFFPEMREDDSWLLDAGQVDNARIRNRVGMNLWMDLVPPMYYQDREPNAINGVRSRIVEVFLNGKYHGFYSMSEAVDRKQLKLKKYDKDTKAIHGQLWKASKPNSYTNMEYVEADYHKTLPNWHGYELKYPDIDDVKPTDWTPLYRAIDFVVNSTDEEFKAQVADRFDIPVLQRYYILYEILLAWDNASKNIYWMIYDKEEQEKVTLAAWDFDATVGQDYINKKVIDWEKLSPERNLALNNRLFQRLWSMNVNNFQTNIKRDYYRLRKTLLKDENIIARYIDEINDLQHAGAAQRETERWSGVIDLCYRDLDFDAQKELIIDWWHRRLAHLDATMFKVTPVAGDVNRDFVADIEDLNASVNVILGLTPYDSDADLNGDGMVDVEDINQLINIILKLQ